MGGPKFRAFFFPPRHNCLSFFSLLGVLSLNFGGVFEGRNPEMCTFGLSGCCVKPQTNRVGPRFGLHAINNLDSRRLEVVVDGLSLFRGAQLAIDTTLVSPLSPNGTARPRCATISGAALDRARIRKERRYRELAGDHGRARVVLAGAIGGRFSSSVFAMPCL